MTQPFVWWKHGVIYQIYPRSFKDATGDGVGDLRGIIAKLDYLEELGVDAIWISPIFKSPMVDFGYDVSDYRAIDPLFGDMAAFEALLEEAHRRGLRIILDYVPNHTSAEHPWFIASRSSRENSKRDWYIWQDAAPGGGPPNNWEAVTGGSGWNWDERSGQYYLALFHPAQPDLNWRNPEVVEAMHDVLRFWLDKGVDGFRMDMLPYLIKHPDFPDNPPIAADHPFVAIGLTQEPLYSMDQPEIHGILRRFRELLDSYEGERVAIGETPIFNLSRLVRYYGESLDELHLPFNFQLLMTPWEPTRMKEALANYYAALPHGATPSLVFGNHDFPRLATRFGYESHRAAAMLLLTAWGVPTIYYGDEIGMENVEVPPERFQDPWADETTSTGRDPERTPMQWDATANAGFAPDGVEPWLPVGADFAEVNVAVESEDPNSTLSFYRRLLALRKALPALHRGSFAFVDGAPADVLAYRRRADEQELLVLVNFGGQRYAQALTGLSGRARTLLSTQSAAPMEVELERLSLRPHEALLLCLQGCPLEGDEG